MSQPVRQRNLVDGELVQRDRHGQLHLLLRRLHRLPLLPADRRSHHRERHRRILLPRSCHHSRSGCLPHFYFPPKMQFTSQLLFSPHCIYFIPPASRYLTSLAKVAHPENLSSLFFRRLCLPSCASWLAEKKWQQQTKCPTSKK